MPNTCKSNGIFGYSGERASNSRELAIPGDNFWKRNNTAWVFLALRQMKEARDAFGDGWFCAALAAGEATAHQAMMHSRLERSDGHTGTETRPDLREAAVGNFDNGGAPPT